MCFLHLSCKQIIRNIFSIPDDEIEQVEDRVSSSSESEETIERCAEFPEDWDKLSALKKRTLLTNLTQFTTGM